eukprot:810648-Prymnesium_polylepis.2
MRRHCSPRPTRSPLLRPQPRPPPSSRPRRPRQPSPPSPPSRGAACGRRVALTACDAELVLEVDVGRGEEGVDPVERRVLHRVVAALD